MKWFLFSIIISLFTITRAHALIPGETNVLVYGDGYAVGLKLSYSQALPYRLEKALHQKGLQVDVVGDGIAGMTSRQALYALNETLSKLDNKEQYPGVMVIIIGYNDMMKDVGLQDIYKNIDEMITRVKQRDIIPVLVGMKAPSTKPKYISKFHGMYRYLANKHQILVYDDYWKGIEKNFKHVKHRTNHPTADAVNKIAMNIGNVVEQAVAQSLRR